MVHETIAIKRFSYKCLGNFTKEQRYFRRITFIVKFSLLKKFSFIVKFSFILMYVSNSENFTINESLRPLPSCTLVPKTVAIMHFFSRRGRETSSSNHHAFFPRHGFVEILWFNWECFTVFVFWLYLFFHQYSWIAYFES
jgi:hypothetical protein